jgi:hypothetical protein
MDMLTDQSCWGLVALALLVDLSVCRHARILRLQWQVSVA